MKAIVGLLTGEFIKEHSGELDQHLWRDGKKGRREPQFVAIVEDHTTRTLVLRSDAKALGLPPRNGGIYTLLQTISASQIDTTSRVGNQLLGAWVFLGTIESVRQVMGSEKFHAACFVVVQQGHNGSATHHLQMANPQNVMKLQSKSPDIQNKNPVIDLLREIGARKIPIVGNPSWMDERIGPMGLPDDLGGRYQKSCSR